MRFEVTAYGERVGRFDMESKTVVYDVPREALTIADEVQATAYFATKAECSIVLRSASEISSDARWQLERTRRIRGLRIVLREAS